MAYKHLAFDFISNKTLLLTGIAILLLAVPFAFAQNSTVAPSPSVVYKLLEPLPCIPDAKTDCPPAQNGQVSTLTELDTTTFDNFFQYAFNLMIALAAVAAVFKIVWGGFLYVTSVSPQMKTLGWASFTNAIYGLLLVFGAFLILRTVSPRLVSFPTSIPKIDTSHLQLRSTTDFFEKLIGEADSYKIKSQEFAGQARVAQEVDTRLVQDKANLESKLAELRSPYGQNLPDDDPQVKAVMVDLARKNEEIRNNKIDVKLKLVNLAYARTISQTLSNTAMLEGSTISVDNIKQTFKRGLDEIAFMADKYERDLAALNAPNRIDDQTTYSEALLRIKRDRLIIDDLYTDVIGHPNNAMFRGKSVGLINLRKAEYASDLDAIETKVSKIKDSKLRAELEEQLDTARQTLKKNLGD